MRSNCTKYCKIIVGFTEKKDISRSLNNTLHNSCFPDSMVENIRELCSKQSDQIFHNNISLLRNNEMYNRFCELQIRLLRYIDISYWYINEDSS